MGLASLGTSIIKNVAFKKIRLLNNIDALQLQFKVSCPTPSELQKIIKKKNQIKTALNQLKKKLLIINKTTKPLKTLIKTLTTTLRTLQINPASAAGLTVGGVLVLNDTYNLSKITKSNITSNLKVFGVIVNYINSSVNEILNKIKQLEILIERCAQNPNANPNIPLSNEIQTAGQNVNETNQIINNSFDINNQLNDEDSKLLGDLQNSDSNDTNSYNGFKFEILLDDKNQTRFPKRYAIAKNASGIVVLRGESSFSSNAEILIDELKFIIDRDDLKAN